MVMLIGAAFSEPDRRADGRGVQAWRDGRPSPQPVDRGAWASRGLRVPARNALLADVVSPQAYGRAYGFERFMDNLGAAGGPLLALGLVAAVGVRTSILGSIVPGLLAAVAIVYAIRRTPRPTMRARQPIRLQVRPLLRGDLGRLLGAASAFEVGNVPVEPGQPGVSALSHPGLITSESAR